MAAPADKSLKNLTGKWTMNKTISDSPEPILALQGIGFLVRKGIAMASIQLDVNEYEAPPKPPNTSTDIFTHIDIEQTAAGLSSTHERRCIDDTWRDHSDWLFGDVTGKTRWVSLDEVDDDFLKTGWEAAVEGKGYITSEVKSKDKGWVAKQIWGFQVIDGVRYYCRNIAVTKGSERVTVRLVYDYTP